MTGLYLSIHYLIIRIRHYAGSAGFSVPQTEYLMYVRPVTSKAAVPYDDAHRMRSTSLQVCAYRLVLPPAGAWLFEWHVSHVTDRLPG